MEATKTSFHIEIGYAGVELDSVGELGELLANKEEGEALEEGSPWLDKSYIPSSSIAMSSPTETGSTPAEPISVWKLILVASIAVGIHLVNDVQIA
ncbi:uncharacterized protein DS421_14g471300 [Arachis hypogaea]|nr:uncharacterized protein DS421_14g471300 [Arachis hypogaea]